jgi:hypothetical protein
MKKIFAAAIAVAVLGFAVPASADTVANFTLDGVTFGGGGTATGGFTLDLTTSTLSNVNVTTSADGDLGTTYTEGIFDSPSTFEFIDGFPPFAGEAFEIDLSDALTDTNLASTNSFTIVNGSELLFFLEVCGLFPCDGRIIAGGSLDSSPATTPLPAALPLFACGLGMLGVLSRRRKRKFAP